MKAAWSVSELAEQGGYVLHPATGVVGRAKRLWTSNEGDRWVSPVNGNEVKAPVLELDTGDAFVITEDAFVPLTAKEVEVYEAFQNMVTSATEVAGTLAAASRVPLETFAALGAAALGTQQRALQKACQAVTNGNAEARAASSKP